MDQNEKGCENCGLKRNCDWQNPGQKYCTAWQPEYQPTRTTAGTEPIQPEPAKEPAVSGCDIVHCKYRDTIKRICTVEGDCIYRSCEIYPYEQEISDLKIQLAACQKELAEAKEQIKEMKSLANALKKDGNFDSRIEKIITKANEVKQ